MKKKIASLSFLLLIVSFLTLGVHPFVTSAAEVDNAETEAGIGFNTNEEKPTLPSTDQPGPGKEEPKQLTNERIPTATRVRSDARIYRRLPQTNMQQQFLITLAGLLLVALVLIVVTHRDRKKVRPVE